MQAKLTDAAAAKAGAGIYFDSDKRSPRGLLLRVTPAGTRAWCLNYRVKDTARERRITIGDVASWPITAAREKAAELRRIIDDGGDPLGELEARRAAPTVGELVERFLSEARPSLAPSTRAEYRAMFDQWILPALGHLKVAAVTREDGEKLHRRITAEGKMRRANSVLTLASAVFEQAIVWRMRTDNPIRGIRRNVEPGRERYLTPEEIERLMTTLDRWRARKPDSVDVVRLAVLSGCRRGELLNATWDQFDLDNAIWSKPASTTKQRRAHRIPLSDDAVAVLRRRLAERDAPGHVVRLRGTDRVFPRLSESGFELDWVAIRAAAGLEDCRFHDLRHSFASLLIGQGFSLPIIGAMLGHAKPATTSRYAHLADAPLREAAAIVGKIVGAKRAK